MSRRWVKILGISLAVLAVLFTLADRLAVHFANKEISRLAKGNYGYGNAAHGYVDLSIKGFPFLTQAAGGSFDHVTLDAGSFFVSDTSNASGGYLDIKRLHLDFHDVHVASLTGRSAQANLVTGTLTLSYEDLSEALSRLVGGGAPGGTRLTVSPAPGSNGQEAHVKVSGTVAGKPVDSVGTILAQADDVSFRVPGLEKSEGSWSVSLPINTGFTEARATEDGLEADVVGHQVRLGSTYR
ncbi:LmeA family phospholipid-binding protein [Streptomyces sp. NPDC001478]